MMAISKTNIIFLQDKAFQTPFFKKPHTFEFHPGSVVKIHNFHLTSTEEDWKSNHDGQIGPSFSDLFPPKEVKKPKFGIAKTLYREAIEKKKPAPIILVKELPKRTKKFTKPWTLSNNIQDSKHAWGKLTIPLRKPVALNIPG